MYFFSTVFILFFLDQLTKYLIVHWMNFGDSCHVIPGFFDVTIVKNTGTIFGLFQQHAAFFVIFSFIALLLILFVFMFFGRHNHITYIACILITAGALGNLSDRIRWGYVVDFLDFHIKEWHWPAFNCADILITSGIILMMLALFFQKDILETSSSH